MTGVIYPFLAIVAAGLVAGLIMRGAMKRFVAQQDRQAKASAIAALIASARKIAVWNSLSASDKGHVESQASEAEVRVRLLPLPGAAFAADWAAHHLAELKRHSVSYSFQSEQGLQDLQDGLIAWQAKPKRAKKLFAEDLAAWRYDSGITADDLAAKQQEWAASQHEPTLAGARSND